MLTLTRLQNEHPLLEKRDLDWEVNGILNPGATFYDGRILLLYRAVGDDHISRFGVATSTDGIHFVFTGDQPVLSPEPQSQYEARGVEDPRITFLNGRYYVVYVGASLDPDANRANVHGWRTRVSLAVTDNFAQFEHKGVMLHNRNDKNAALFPVQWGEWYHLYHRHGGTVGMSRSLDLNAWESVAMAPGLPHLADDNNWDSGRSGIGAPPLYTDDGWLVFYHGRDAKGTYRIGAFLADYERPNQIIAKLPYPLLEPKLGFECTGPLQNVAFPCGAVEAGDGYWVYYGGAQSGIGGAFIAKRDLLTELKRHATVSVFQG